MPTQAEGINIIGSGLPQLTTVQEVLGKSLETAHRDVDNTVVNSELPISVLLAAVNTFLAGPNLRKDLRKQVRFYSPATAGYVAGQNTLTTLAANTLCLGCVAGVDFGPDGYGKEYRLVYDPTGPLQVRNDASFLGDLVPARWVLVGSEQESTSGVEVYNPLAGRVPLGATRLYTLGGYGRQFEAKQELIRTAFPDSRIPAPTGLGSDEYWKEIPLTQPGYVPFQVIGEALANELVSEGQVRASLYRLTRFDEAEDGLTRARSEFDVFLQGLPPDAFRPAAVAVDNTTGARTEGTYDLATDTFTPGTPGAGVTYVAGTGISISGNTISATGSSTPGPVSWGDIQNKPTSFTPSTHNQPASTITGLAAVATSGSYSDLSNKPTIPAAYTDTQADARVAAGAATAARTAGVGDVAPWVAGPQRLGQLSFSGGRVWRAKVAIGNSTTAPESNLNNYALVGPDTELQATVAALEATALTPVQKQRVTALTALIEQRDYDGTLSGESSLSAALQFLGDDRALTLHAPTFMLANDASVVGGVVQGNGAAITVAEGETLSLDSTVWQNVSLSGALSIGDYVIWDGSPTSVSPAITLNGGTLTLRDVPLGAASSISGTGTVLLQNSSSIDADVEVAPGVTIVRPGSGGGEDPRKDLTTEPTKRTNNLRREGKSHVSNIVLAENATAVSAQLLQGGVSMATARTGTPAQVATALNADIDALSDYGFYTLRFITTPANSAAFSTVLLTVLPA